MLELRSGQVMSCQFCSGQCRIKADDVWSNQDKVMSGQVRSYQVSLCQVRTVSDQIRSMSSQIMLGQVRSCQVRSSPSAHIRKRLG